MSKKRTLPKERNPFLVHMVARKQGAHGKTKKTIRRDNKIILKKDYLIKLT